MDKLLRTPREARWPALYREELITERFLMLDALAATTPPLRDVDVMVYIDDCVLIWKMKRYDLRA